MKIKKLEMVLYFLWIALFKIYLIPKVVQQMGKIVFICVVIFYFLNRMSKKNIFNLTLPWCGMIVITGVHGVMRNYISLSNGVNSILHAICIYCIYIAVRYCSEKNCMESLFKTLYNILMLYNIFSLISIFCLGTSSNSAIIYFAGDKFRTSYYFIMWVALFYVKYYVKIESLLRYKMCYVILCCMCVFMCYTIKCSTTVIGSIFLFLGILEEPIRKILKQPIIIFFTLGGAATILLISNVILKNAYVYYIITELLGENIGLTGRYVIYGHLQEVIMGSPWLGYGYGNYAVGTAVGFGNAQNAIMQLIVDYGFLGLLVFLVVFTMCVRRSLFFPRKWSIYVYLYIVLICSSVEISFNYQFYTILFIMLWYKELNKGMEV